MEAVGQASGLLWLDLQLGSDEGGPLTIASVRDLALVFNGAVGQFLGSTYRAAPTDVPVPAGVANVSLLIDVMGRLNYGGQMTGAFSFTCAIWSLLVLARLNISHASYNSQTQRASSAALPSTASLPSCP